MANLPGYKLETDKIKKDKLESFKQMVLGQLCMAYSSPDNLALNVITSLSSLMKKHPRCGWVRGDTISSDEANKKILFLQKENEQLKDELRSYRTIEDEELKTYQQHNDVVKLSFVTSNNQIGNPFGVEFNEKPVECQMTWDEIFTVVGGSFTSPVRTSKAIDILSRDLSLFKGCYLSHYLATSCGQMILSQLYALRYLELKTGEVFQSGVESYYVLTEYGMKEFVNLTAIRK